MKKFTAFFCAATMALGMSVSALAAPSIGELIPEAPTLLSGEIKDGWWLTVTNADPDKYEDESVKDIVTRFNDDDDLTATTVVDVLEALGIDLTKETITTEGNVIDPTLYKALTPFVDLVITNGTEVAYKAADEDAVNAVVESEAETEVMAAEEAVEGIKASVKVEPAKDLKKENLALMQIDPFTAEVYFIELDDYVPETGEITATFPCLGPIMVLYTENPEAALKAPAAEAAVVATEAATEAVVTEAATEAATEAVVTEAATEAATEAVVTEAATEAAAQ